MALSPNHKLGAYEIVCPLGAGGMGEVYRARDSRLGRDVALKVLPPDVTNEPGRLERFDREARAIAALNHPHIITIFSTEECDGIRFLTMELVDGCTLGDLIVPNGMPVAKFLEIALPLADALAAAHQKQITHRDLKPGNVMVSNDGRVKVLDFGLARVGGGAAAEETLIATAAPITQRGTILGTMPYMSPEQVEGRPLDPRTDLFSLGVIFYELLSGSRPFSGSSSPALMSAILRDTPSSVAGHRPEIPEALDRLIGRLLEKRPEDRVQTARDVFNELRHAQKQMEPGARARPAAPGEASIAVLPFSDLSATRDQDWFCDGIAEELLNALAGLPGLRVAARASAFSLRGKGDDLRTIGEKLNVSTVLEGSVRRAGDRVRITAQLSDTREGRQLWSERFDREITDIFDVQEEIARAIVERLKLTISHDSSERLVQKTTANIEAYQLLLKGRELLFRRGPAIFAAIPLFERVIAIDPEVAEAHALLGDAHRLTGLYGLVIATTAMPRALQSVTRALEIEPNQVEALATLANVRSIYEWDMPGALTLSDRALARDASHVRAHAERAISMAAINGSASIHHRVLADIARARALDPLNAWVMAIEALCVAMTGRPEAAVDIARSAVTLDGNNFSARWALLSTLAWCGRDAEAQDMAAAGLAMSGRHPRLLAELAAIHAGHGDRDAAAAIHDELQARARNQYVGFAEQAVVAACAGEIAAARGLLAQAITARDPYLTFWKLPSWRVLWNDAECSAILRGISLTKPLSN